MRLVDIDNIDYVILEDSLHRIEHKKGDEIDCVIGAEIVQAIPLDRIKQAKKEIQNIKENESLISKGGFECYGFRQKTAYEIKNEAMEILDNLITESED